MDYKELLEHSYKVASEAFECAPESRLEYLSDYILDFTTYDRGMSVLFASKAVEVCAEINNGTTFTYIEGADNYIWFLVMCNMPFFADRLEWGTSIRGAWWTGRPGKQIEFNSCGLWMGDEQLTDTLEFSADEWKHFISAVVEFAAVEMKPTSNMKKGEKCNPIGLKTVTVRVHHQQDKLEARNTRSITGQQESQKPR